MRGGIIEMAPEEIDFAGTYTFEETGPSGQVLQWTGIRPEHGPDGRAVFRLPLQALDANKAETE